MAGMCYNCFRNLETDYQICPFCGFQIYGYVSSPRALVPETLLDNKYIVGKTLGEGGFGITYLAWDRNMKTKAAIKEYFPRALVARDTVMYGGNTLHTLSEGERNDFEVGLKRYVEEAAILAKFFQLPGIVSVKDFFYANGTAYIVMEYIDGISLKDFLKSKGGKLSVEETLRIMEPIISSLAVVHGHKLLHRDISPDNIMLGRDGTVKLIDFGAARYFDKDKGNSKTVVLKHGYAPVEQYSRKGEQGAWTDVYALCAVIYRMLTGIVPEESVDRVGEDRLRPLGQAGRNVPKYIAQAVEKGLSVSPEGRQQTMQELHGELYITRERRRSMNGDKIYRMMQRCMVILIVLLTVIAGGTMFYLKNREKIDDLKNKAERILAEETEEKPFVAGESHKPGDETGTKETGQEEVREQTDNKPAEKETEAGQSTVVKENLNSGETRESADAGNIGINGVMDPDVEHAVLVARDGTLNGKNQSFTVGNILEMYSDSEGLWTGYKDEKNQIFIYYQGMKNGESFAVEFTVYENDTFKVTGAAKNGEPLERYSDFFQEILNDTGI